jgi:type IV pilus assembly protein PilW
MKRIHFPRSLQQRGFTLIELMVGLLLSMLTILVITQTLATSEGKKRTTAMGSDAQSNGAMSLYTLQRDIQMAGYGLTSSPDALGCDVKARFAANPAFDFTLAPVIITDGANGAPDSFTVLRGRASGFLLPMILSGNHKATDDYFVVSSTFGAAMGNIMIAVPKLQGAGSWCTLFQVAEGALAANKLDGTILPHVVDTHFPWNQSDNFPSGGYATDDYLLNMTALQMRTYAIDGSNTLRVTEFVSGSGASTVQDLYPQIVNLQVMYGKGSTDSAGNVIVDTYDNVPPANSAEWQRVVAIRLAVVSRSMQHEKEEVTLAQPKWDVGLTAAIGPATTACNGGSKCIVLKVDHLDDWKHYRYKVFDTIVPLRNVIWNS